MVRLPEGWIMATPAGSQAARGISARRIPVPPIGAYVNPVTVDLGNDGMAPNVLFGAAGTAQALVGPSSGGDLWSLDQCYVSTSVGQLDASQCAVFSGPLPLAQYGVTASLAGGASQFGMGGIGVPFGWFVYAVWSGGVPGATAYLRVTGTKTVLSN
jgi:hypothetical protein